MNSSQWSKWKWVGAPQNGVLALFETGNHTENPMRKESDNPLDQHPRNEPQTPAQDTTPSNQHLHAAIRLVLLAIEIVMALAAGMLLVWCGTIAKSLVRVLCATLSTATANVAGEAVYTAIFVEGMVRFMMRLFQQRDRALFTKRLGIVSWPAHSIIIISVTIHSMLVVLLTSSQATPTFTDKIISYVTSDPTAAMRGLLLVPLQEELFFRGVVFHLGLNRLHGNALHSGIISSVCFSLVHLANARHSDALELLTQVMWAFVVGVYLALRYARQGSLLECAVLHAINNIFTAGVAASTTDNEIATLVQTLGALSILVYAVGGWYEHRMLSFS